jgi:VWFA-related protein
MNARRRLVPLAVSSLVLAFAAASSAFAQSGVRPKPTPTPEDDDERVYTEEVRIPVFASDEKGRFDPSVELSDVLVVEDEVPQQVKSVRRIPASVMLLLATGGELNPAMRVSTTRDIALGVVGHLREGDHVAAVQFNNKPSLVQEWTTDRAQAELALRSRLAFRRGSRLSQAIIRAAQLFEGRPVGNRHLVIVTDGVEAPGYYDQRDAMTILGVDTPETKAQAAEAVRRLNTAQVTIHVISYSSVSRAAMKEREKPKELSGMAQSRQDMATVGIDPTRPPGMRGPGINPTNVNTGMKIDPGMRRVHKAYERAIQKGEERLKALAEETAGSLAQPTTEEEMFEKAAAVARDIGTQYVVTYRPKRPLATSPATEYRRVRVTPRRIGLSLRARRGYVVGAMR